MKSTARVLSLAIFLLAAQKNVLCQQFEIKVPTLSVAAPGDSQAPEIEAAPAASRDTPFVETPGEIETNKTPVSPFVFMFNITIK